MHSLPLFVRLQGRPVILLGEGDGADAKRRLLERAGAKIVGESGQAALAIVAIEEEEEAAPAIARLKARGILVNAVDRPADCDFTLPAIVDRDPVIVAIGTGGASAGLAKALRQRLEAALPQSIGALATRLSQSRVMLKAKWPAPADRRKAIDGALDPGGPLDPFQDFVPNAFDAWLSDDSSPNVAASLSFTLTSGDPDDLTLAAARALGRADLVVHTEGLNPAILARARADANRAIGHELPNPLPSGLTVLLTRG
jgi:uroporphyrin-III C-methyltransferase / precorrin-2 dehydrogenase / sirohydrochlorin ferrochelatase